MGNFRILLNFKTSLLTKSLLWINVIIHSESRTNYRNKNFAPRLLLKMRLPGTRNGLLYAPWRKMLYFFQLIFVFQLISFILLRNKANSEFFLSKVCKALSSLLLRQKPHRMRLPSNCSTHSPFGAPFRMEALWMKRNYSIYQQLYKLRRAT